MTAADRLNMLRVLGVNVQLACDGASLDVSGRRILVDVAEPTLRQHRDELLDHLRSTSMHRAT